MQAARKFNSFTHSNGSSNYNSMHYKDYNKPNLCTLIINNT